MRSTYQGVPAWIDLSDENAVRLASSLDAAAGKAVRDEAHALA
jgi:hypothetical protein